MDADLPAARYSPPRRLANDCLEALPDGRLALRLKRPGATAPPTSWWSATGCWTDRCLSFRRLVRAADVPFKVWQAACGT